LIEDRFHMPQKLITCPDTAHLEQIEYDDHSLGLLIVDCTALRCDAQCERSCAARLDRRRRTALADLNLDDDDPDVDGM
jgi:hypothetical protein